MATVVEGATNREWSWLVVVPDVPSIAFEALSRPVQVDDPVIDVGALAEAVDGAMKKVAVHPVTGDVTVTRMDGATYLAGNSKGPAGPPGPGIPAGGTAGQVPAKAAGGGTVWADAATLVAPATTTRAGLMSGADKLRLDAAPTVETLTAATASALTQANAYTNEVAPGPRLSLMGGWTSAVARATTARANVLVIGDSISEGAWALTYQDGWVHVLRRLLQQSLTGRIGGLGYIPAIRGFLGTANSFPATNGDQWLFTGSPPIDRTETNISGLGRRAISLTGAQTASMTFVGDRFQLLFTGQSGSGVASISVDDGAAQTFPTTQAVATSGLSYVSAQLSPGPHTVTVKASTGTITLDGGCFFDGDYTAGVTVWDASHSGYRTDHFDGHDAASKQWADGITAASPALVLIALGTNDEHQAPGAYTPALYGERLAAIVALVRTKAPAANIAFVLQPRPGSSSQPASWWDDHMRAARATASTARVAILDLQSRIPAGPTGSGSTDLYFNQNHPNSAGQRAYAQAVMDLIAAPRATDQNASNPAGASNSASLNVANTSATTYTGDVASTSFIVPTSGRVIVWISARITLDTAGKYAYLGFTAAGANTITSSGSNCIRVAGGVASCTYTMPVSLTGLTPGQTTFTTAPWVNGGTAIMGQFSIVVLPA